jgi:hypothetical protein
MLGIINVGIKGICPKISNNPDAINTLPSGRNIDRDSKEYREQSFQASLYKDRGKLYQPAEHLERCMEVAGKEFKFKGRVSYMQILKGGIIVEPNRIPIPKKDKPEHFRRWVVIKGNRVSKTRAIFNKWTLDFNIRVFNDAINFETLKEILIYGGAYIGIGDWRPKYGRFEVIKFKKGKK